MKTKSQGHISLCPKNVLVLFLLVVIILVVFALTSTASAACNPHDTRCMPSLGSFASQFVPRNYPAAAVGNCGHKACKVTPTATATATKYVDPRWTPSRTPGPTRTPQVWVASATPLPTATHTARPFDCDGASTRGGATYPPGCVYHAQ